MIYFLSALQTFLSPLTLLLTLVGAVVGLVLGAIPGLSGGTAITVLLPFTFAMNPLMAMAMLVGIYVGGESGGYISAILLGIPGTSTNIATVYDGYEMTKKGEATRALSIATVSNFLGTFPSIVVAMIACPVIAAWAVKMGPWEYFSLTFMAITLVISLSQGNLVKGFIAMALGLFLAEIGISPISATTRFTFGTYYLSGGLNLLGVLIGLFAGSMIVLDYAKGNKGVSDTYHGAINKFHFPGADIAKNVFNIIRSFLIGVFIGFLPGMGPTLSNVVSYGMAKNGSKHPEAFGTGCADGVFAPEVANNASVGGALIPMISLGIPGDGITVFLLSALTMHGISLGPLLQKSNPEIVYMIFIAAMVSALFVLAVEILGIRQIPKVLKVPYHYLYPAILVISLMGVYANAMNMFALYTFLGITVLGIFMTWAGIPLTPFLLAYVLGGMMERNFRNAVSYAGGDLLSFFKRPVSCIMLIIAIASVVLPMIKNAAVKGKGEKSNE